mgnify:CR=1 FL=1
MGVLFGCISLSNRALAVSREALMRAAFVGHDSSGLAFVEDGELKLYKDAGPVEEFLRGVDADAHRARACIGHTRWATHGAPAQVNAHPHTDCTGRIAVAHSGIIENFAQVRAELEAKGHKFRSKTDTEVLAHLVEEAISSGSGLREAVASALRAVEGSVAAAFVCSSEPETVLCACKNSSLFVARGPDGFACSSELACLCGIAEAYSTLSDGELALLRPDGAEFFDVETLRPVEKAFEPFELGLDEARKGGKAHMLLREIWEQARFLADSLRLQRDYLDQMASMLGNSEEVFLVGSGPSYNACLAASYLFSSLAYKAAHAVRLEDFAEHYGNALGVAVTVLIADEKGDGPELRELVELARGKGATVIGITNRLGSYLTHMARVYVCQHSGPPLGVRPMRTFTAQALVLAQLALRIAELRGKIGHIEMEEYREALSAVPSLVEETIRLALPMAEEVAARYADRRFFFVLGRGIGYPTALEGVRLLVEVAGVAGLSYPAGESKHGPISLVEEGFPVIFVCQRDETHDAVMSNIKEMEARGAHIIAVAEEGDEAVREVSHDVLPVPDDVPAFLTPIIYAIPLQLLAYFSALSRGLDPDEKARGPSGPR